MTLADHLKTGATTVCRCWAVTRNDGVELGFTDHDTDIEFETILFRADSGMTAKEVEQSAGLSVDNSEAIGVLSHSAISETHIEKGLFDGAEVRYWLVNWSNVSERELRFRGEIGEIRRNSGEFTAELRGLAEALNKPNGRVFQRGCRAVLGDSECQFDTSMAEFCYTGAPLGNTDNSIFEFDGLATYAVGWFTKGMLSVSDGSAGVKPALIKNHTILESGNHEIELWQPLKTELPEGAALRLVAGCDKRMKTCLQKFDNLLNFRGFPDIPGEDWLVSTPIRTSKNDGGSLR